MSESVEKSDHETGSKTARLGPRSINIPVDWDVVAFGQAIEINPNYSKPSEGPFDYLPMDAVDEDNQTIEYWTKREKDDCTNTWFKNGDTVYAKITPCTENGKIAFINGLSTEVGSGSTEFLVFHPHKTRIDERFVHYFSNLSDFRSVTISLMEGSTGRQRVPSDVFEKRIEVPLPPLPEQRRIVDILSTVDEQIQRVDQIIKKSYSLRQGLIQDFFNGQNSDARTKEIRVGAKKKKIPQHWDLRRLEEVSDVKRGASPRPISDDRYFGGSVGWVRISDITRSEKYLEKTTDYLSDEGVSESVLIRKGTVLLSISATIGKPAILQNDACIHDGIVAFRDLDDEVDPEYLYYALLEMKKRLKSQNQRAAGHQTNINSTVVKRSKILLPPLEEQENIKNTLAKVDDNLSENKKERKQLRGIKRGLIQDLLTGKVRVSTD